MDESPAQSDGLPEVAPPGAVRPVEPVQQQGWVSSLAGRLVLLVIGVLVVGAALGGLLGLVAAYVNPGGSVTASGPPPTVDPAGGIPPAPEAGGVVGSVDGGPFSISAVVPFDPQGDADENGDQTRASWDGDPDSGWTTEVYEAADFGGLKEGVGLVYDLGGPQTVGAVVVRVGDPTGLALYAADTIPDSLAGFEQVAEAAPQEGGVELVSDGRTARYWLVWVTELPSDGVASLNEVTFVP